jgi:ABC-2 type transport system permease protein
VTAAVIGAGLIVMWCGRPGLRSDYKARGKGSFLVNMLELFNSLSWGALAGLLVSASSAPLSGMTFLGAAAALALGCLTLGTAWLLRRPQP